MLLQPMTPECPFPLFRDKFLSAAPRFNIPSSPSGCSNSYLHDQRHRVNEDASTSERSSGHQTIPRIDLSKVKQESSEPTEDRNRRGKMALCERVASKVLDGLFISGEYPARTLDLLQQAGITHIINCAGAIIEEHFPDRFKYLTLFLQDSANECIMSVVPDCIEFIENARRGGGNVLVHCWQGVSRSVTIVTAYSMWKLDLDLNTVTEQIKLIREVASPNSGFFWDLQHWEKRRKGLKEGPYISRLGPQSRDKPRYIVPKPLLSKTWEALDSRGVFIIQFQGFLYVWVGRLAHQALIQAAEGIATRFINFVVTKRALVDAVDEGKEPDNLASALTGEGSGPPPSARIRLSADLRINKDYDPDYELLDQEVPRTSQAAGGPDKSVLYTGSRDDIFPDPPSRLAVQRSGMGGRMSSFENGTTKRQGLVPPLELTAVRRHI